MQPVRRNFGTLWRRVLTGLVPMVALVTIAGCGGGGGSAAKSHSGAPSAGSSMTVQGQGYKLRVTLTGIQNPVIATDVEVPQGMHFVGVQLRFQNVGPAFDGGDITNSQLTDSDGRTSGAPGSAIGPANVTMPGACNASSVSIQAGGTATACLSFPIADGLKPIRFDLVVDSPEPNSAAIGGDHIWHLSG